MERSGDSGRNRDDYSAVRRPVRHTTSGSDGSYRFDGLPDGTYRVDFELRGFELVRRNHVRVRRDSEAKADAACRCARSANALPSSRQAPGHSVLVR